MTNEELQAILQMLVAILQELKKANQRPLYIVVNDQKAVQEFVAEVERQELLRQCAADSDQCGSKS